MKTHIIQLDPYDDAVSVRDKMAWGKTPRILLVWPEKDGRILDSKLDLLLIKRRAVELGAQIALVTKNPEVRFWARALEIPVFNATRQAQTSRWRRRRRRTRFDIWRRRRAAEGPPDVLEMRRYARGARPAWVHSFPARVGFFLLGVLSVLALAAFIFPSAQITLTPETQTQQITFTALTSPSITRVNPSGTIPTRPIEVVVEGVHSIETTGSVEIPDQPATGRVQFTNLTDVAVVIPEGTVVMTMDSPPVRFVTTRQARTPAETGGVVDVPVQAVQPGSQGNVPAGAIRTIEGTLGLQLTVTNPSPTSGGSDQTLAAPSQLDRRRAYRQLLDQLRATAAAEIQALLGPGDLLLSTTPFLLTTLEETYTPEDTRPADTLQVSLRLEFQGLVVTEVELRELAQLVLDASLPAGFRPLPGTLTIEQLTQPQLDTELSANWQIRAQREIAAEVNAAQAVALTLGQPPATARERLAAALPLSQPPVIELTPDWWPRLPLLGFRIEVGVGG